MFDNRKFDVNGRGPEMLKLALELVLNQTGMQVRSWKKDLYKGLVLYWLEDMDDAQKFITPPSIDTLANMVWDWIRSDEQYDIKLEKDEVEFPSDAGSNTRGWRVYYDRENGGFYQVITIKPINLWHSK